MRPFDPTLALSVVLLLLLPGCGGVLSDHPLSTDADSVVDDRLIGWWEQIPKPGDEAKPQGRFLIGRLAGSENTLELVTLELGQDDTVTVERRRIYTVRLGGTWHLSLANEDKAEFAIARYRMDDGGRVTLEGLDERATADAIEKGTIEGQVTSNPKYTGPGSRERAFREVRLTAEATALRVWLTGAGSAAFGRSDQPFVRKLPIPRPGAGARKAK